MTPIPDDSWDDLLPKLDGIARQIAQRLNMTATTREDFFASVAEKIFIKRADYDPNLGTMSGWCQTVLLRHGVDIIRKHGRHQKMMERFVEEVKGRGELYKTPVEIDDSPRLDGIEALQKHADGLDRVLVAIDCQLLSQLESARTRAWLSDADLPKHFPWQEIEAIDEQAARRKALVRILGVNPGWLRQRIFRTLKAMATRVRGDHE